MGLMTMCGSEIVGKDEVFSLNPPAHTRSWRPVAYRDAISQLHDTIESQLNLPIVHEEYALNKKGNQLFHVARVETGNDEAGLAIALRQSYDKSLSLGVAAGAQVMVCDNLCFDGSAFKVMRKNTVNVWEDFRRLIQAQVACSLDAYTSMTVDFEKLKSIPCNERRGFAYLGVMLGEKIITPTQASVAFADWREARHEDFAERNMWGLYNAVTEGLKKGQAGRTIDRHVAAHGWFKGLPDFQRLAA